MQATLLHPSSATAAQEAVGGGLSESFLRYGARCSYSTQRCSGSRNSRHGRSQAPQLPGHSRRMAARGTQLILWWVGGLRRRRWRWRYSGCSSGAAAEAAANEDMWPRITMPVGEFVAPTCPRWDGAATRAPLDVQLYGGSGGVASGPDFCGRRVRWGVARRRVGCGLY